MTDFRGIRKTFSFLIPTFYVQNTPVNAMKKTMQKNAEGMTDALVEEVTL